MPHSKNSRIVWMLLATAALLLTSCNQAGIESLERTVQELQVAQDRLTTENERLSNQNAELEQQVAELSVTEENLFARATEALGAGEHDEARAMFQDFLVRYPESSRVAEANEALTNIRDAEALVIVQEADWYANDGQFDAASHRYEMVLSEFGASPAAARARDGLSNLETLRAQEAAARAGFMVGDVQSYWTSEQQLAGRSLLVPEVRFKIRPASDPITYLQLQAVFFVEDEGQLDQFGDGSAYVVGSSDIPIQPGHGKEVWLTSGVGYVDNGGGFGIRLLSGDAPYTRADLYYKTDFGSEWIQFTSVDVESTYRY